MDTIYNPNRYIAKLDEMIAARRMIEHPFYRTWTRGELSIDALQDYAKQYYHHVAAFPTYLSAVHAQTEDTAVRRVILQNLIDEEAGSPNHPEMWLDFVEGLGLDRSTPSETAVEPETSALISAFKSACGERGTAAGLAALFAYESQIPEVAESKLDGLKRYYAMSDTRSTAYFSVHIEADREHSSAERLLLTQYVDEVSFDDAAAATGETLDALWKMLSGVCRRHGIGG